MNAHHVLLQEEKKGDLLVKTALKDGNIQILFINDGPPIPQAVLPKIFDPFYTTKIKTTQGMGLSFVQGYIRQIGGHLRVNSSYGLGTTVYFYIPLSTNINQNTFDL